MTAYLDRYETRTQHPKEISSQAASALEREGEWDYESDLELGYEVESEFSEPDQFEAPTLSKKEAYQLIRERSAELRKLKDRQGLKKLEELYRKISQTPGKDVPSALVNLFVEGTGQAARDDGDADLGLEGLMGPEAFEEVDLGALRTELNQLKDSVEANEDLPEDQKEAYLEKIGKWSSALDLRPSAETLESIREGMEAMKLGEDVSVADGEDEYIGITPTRVEKGIRYYESQYGQPLDLVPTGKGSQNLVTTSGEVTITPQDPKAPVEVSQEGGFFIVRVRGGEKEDVYKVKSNASKLKIESENVSGDLENEDGVVTAGSKGEKYISPERLANYAQVLKAGVGKVGGDFKKDGLGRGYLDGGLQYSADTQEKNEDVKKVLEIMAQALESKEPKAKKELWEEATDIVANWLNVDSEKLGSANDRAAMVCRVLHGEFGERGFKQLLKDGILPREFAEKLVEVISIRQDEVFSEEDGNRGRGSLHWNHKKYADFLDKHSKSSV